MWGETNEKLHPNIFVLIVLQSNFAGTTLAFMNQEGGLSIFDIITRTTKQVMDNTVFVRFYYHTFELLLNFVQRSLKTVQYSLSANISLLLLSYDEIPLFRYSKEARYSYIQLGER